MSMNRHDRRKALKSPLYQVFAETSDGDRIAVSPKMVRMAAEQVMIGVKQAIVAGRIDWGNVGLELATKIH